MYGVAYNKKMENESMSKLEAANVRTYEMEILDYKTLQQVHALIDNLYELMSIQNDNSDKSIEGGAACHMELEIKVSDIWM